MKKTYIAPEIELVRLSSVSVIATSLTATEDETGTVTDDNTGGIEFNSNGFQGGLFDEE